MISVLLILICVILAIPLSIYIYFQYKYFHWRRKGVPYISPTFPFGNFKDVLFGKQNSGTIVAEMYRSLKSRGAKFGGFFAIQEPNFLLIDLDLIKTIMIKEFSSFCERGMYYDEEKDPLSAHLIALRNPKWHFLRKKFSPTFTPAKMKLMYPLIMACGEDLKKVFEEKATTGEPVEIYEVLARFTTDIIGTCVYGLEMSSQQDEQNEFRKNGKIFFDQSLKHSVTFTLSLCAPSIVKWFKLSLIKSTVTDFFIKTIADTVHFREKNHVERSDMLDLLLKLKNNESIGEEPTEKESPDESTAITFNNLVAQAFVFFIGGYENTSSAMTFALYELALNPIIQDRLRDEINATIRQHGELTFENISEMPYLNMVVNETVRKYPAVPFMNRECVADYIIPGTNVKIEKGTVIIIPTLGIHMDEEFYPDPEKFDPERFSEKNKDKIPSGAFLTFGQGPRSCIGTRFGIMQVKVGLSLLISRFKFSLSPGVQVPIGLHPKTFVLAFERKLFLNVEKIYN